MNKAVFFVGIKGVGMTSLACAMQDAGWVVSGCDTDEEFITDEVLLGRKIQVFPSLKTAVPDGTDLVICSAAYEPPNTSVRTIPLAVALAEFVKDRRVIAVAGVGGKTTTTAMLAALFHAAGRDVGYYVGTSTIAGLHTPGHCGTDPYFVVEADEYAVSKVDKRAKFELLKPDIIITTNIVHDHPDIYPDESATRAVFARLINSLPSDGLWLYDPQDPVSSELAAELPIRKLAYSIDPTLSLSVFGKQNAKDAAAAVKAAIAAGVNESKAREAIFAYQGAGRRQEFHGEVTGRKLYDDYGHHPAEIAITVCSFQEKFPGSRILLVFESHTYSRTESLLGEFAKSIASADLPIIMPIFESAREKGKKHQITPKSFAAEVAKHNPLARSVTWDNAAEVITSLSQPGDIILTMGAGFVYKLHRELKNFWRLYDKLPI